MNHDTMSESARVQPQRSQPLNKRAAWRTKFDAISVMLIVFILSTYGVVSARRTKPLPASVSEIAPGLHPLGTARHTVFGMPVFDATLWVVGRHWSPAEPHALDVSASRNIPPARLVNGVMDEMRDLKAADDRQRAQWQADLLRIVPPLARGDQLVVLCLADRKTLVYFNGLERGSINDPNFGAALFRVWLDPMSSRPDIRNALLQY